MYVATYTYFILSLIGYQQLNSEPEILFPVFLVLKFVFFIGWLKVWKIYFLKEIFFSQFPGGRSYQSPIWGRRGRLSGWRVDISSCLGHRQDPITIQRTSGTSQLGEEGSVETMVTINSVNDEEWACCHWYVILILIQNCKIYLRQLHLLSIIVFSFKH